MFYGWQYETPQFAYLSWMAIPFFFLFWNLISYKRKTIKQLLGSELVPDLLSTRSSKITWVKTICFCLAWILASFALMQPKGNPHYPEYPLKGDQNEITKRKESGEVVKMRRIPQNFIFLIDTSTSMAVKDTRGQLSRLDTAKEFVNEMVSQIGGDNAALYSFAGDLSTLVPPTYDHLFLRLVLNHLTINEGGIAGTNFANALEKLKKKFWIDSDQRHFTVIILSDGEDTVLEPETIKIEHILEPLKNPLDTHLRVFTIGIGSKEGGQIPSTEFQGQPTISKLNENLLKQISLSGQGKYYSASNTSPLETAQLILGSVEEDIQKIDTSNNHRHSDLSSATQEPMYDLYFQIPLGIAILLLLITLYTERDSILGSFCFSFFYLFLIPFEMQPLSAENPVWYEEGELAKTYFLIGEHQRARELYKTMLSSFNPLWKRNILEYNVGTISLTENHIQDAMRLFKTIEIKKDTSPLFVRYLSTNMGISELMQAQLALTPQKNNLYFANFFIKESLEHFQNAQLAECQLEQLEAPQEHKCLISYDLLNLINEATIVQHNVRLAIRQQRLSKLSFDEILTLLHRGLRDLNGTISPLATDQPSKFFESEYENYFKDLYSSLQPLWNKVILESEEIKQSEQMASQAIQLLGQGLWKKGMEQLIASENVIKTIQKKRINSMTDYQRFHRLIFLYQLTLDQDTIAITDLKTLETERENFQFPSENQEVFKQSGDFLSKSILLMQNQKEIASRFFLQSSLNTLRDVEPYPINPKDILEMLIHLQKEALSLNLLGQSLKSEESSLVENAQKMIVELQEKVLKLAPLFITSSIKEQTRLYRESINTSSSHCQQSPWNQIFPLFDAGYQSAFIAAKTLPPLGSSLSTAKENQEETIEKWSLALEFLSAPFQRSDEEPLIDEEQPQTSINATFELLQEMDIEDTPPSVPMKINTPGGLQPW